MLVPCAAAERARCRLERLTKRKLRPGRRGSKPKRAEAATQGWLVQCTVTGILYILFTTLDSAWIGEAA
jgi:hypothetical protein